MISILLSDDHQILRQGVRALLDGEDDFEVVGEAADGRETLDAVDRLHPDILILDLSLPGLHGLEVTRRVAKQAATTQVVILSMHADEGHVAKALQNGAKGYVLKGRDIEELARAVRQVAAGRYYLSPPLSQVAIRVYAERASDRAPDPYDLLTSREKEVLQLVAEGATNAAIAEQLFVSRRTVESHRASFMRKLGLRSQAELVRFAIAQRLVLLEPDPNTWTPPAV